MQTGPKDKLRPRTRLSPNEWKHFAPLDDCVLRQAAGHTPAVVPTAPDGDDPQPRAPKKPSGPATPSRLH